MDQEYKEISRRLKIARTDRGLTLSEAGDKLNLSKATLSRYENGIVENMNLPTLQALAKLYNVNDMWLLGKSNEKYPKIRDYSQSVNSVPLLGTIAAGTPILAEENITDYFNLDNSIKADFCLKVKGESMIDANIFSGDIAFIKKQDTLENGEIGAILIEDEATLKIFYQTEDSVILQPANKNFAPIILTSGNIKILGKLVAVLNIR